MNEQSMENPAILQKWLLKRRSRDDGEREEITMQDDAGEHGGSIVLPQETAEENNEDSALLRADDVADKEKQARVQSVFSMVRSQIRTQAGLEGRCMGILDVVNQIKEVERSKRDKGYLAPTVKITSFEEEAVDQDARRETVEEGAVEMEKNNKERGQDVCVALLEEILMSLESLKKDLREDLAQLRSETQSYMEREICGLETRLTHSLRMQTPSALPMETKKQRPPSMPPLGTCRRRMLNRTMTTITPKTCPPFSLGPRSNSDPLRVSGAETVTSNGAQMPRRGEMLNPPGPLPPAQPPAQMSKRTLRSRSRVGKMTTG